MPLMPMLYSRLLLLLIIGWSGTVLAADQAPSSPGVPVTTSKAVKRDVATSLDGLGTIQAFNTVLIRSQVDGQLTKLSVTEGQEVHAGDVLFEIDRRIYQAAFDQAVAKKAQDQALLTNAKLDLARYAELVDKNYIARQQLDTTQAQVNQLTATVQGDEAAIETARVTLGYTQIRSPIDGRVGIRQVDVGNIVHANDSAGLVTITQLQPIHMIFSLPEENLQAILQASAKHSLMVSALSRDGQQHLGDGELDLLDNQVDPATGTVKLRATLPNKDRSLWPGQFVNARLIVGKIPGAVTIPNIAVQNSSKGHYVYVVSTDNTVEMRPVEVGPVSNGDIVILKGIRENETVVTTGQFRLQPGSKVEARQTAATTS